MREKDSKVVIHATECLWKNKKGWTPKVCASIEKYDIGLLDRINKNVRYHCTRKRR